MIERGPREQGGRFVMRQMTGDVVARVGLRRVGGDPLDVLHTVETLHVRLNDGHAARRHAIAEDSHRLPQRRSHVVQELQDRLAVRCSGAQAEVKAAEWNTADCGERSPVEAVL